MTLAAVRTLRPVYCAIDHLHRDLNVARDACAGRFHVAGTTLVVGHSPDWRAVDVDTDRERWIEWSKFYYGLDLAHAFAETGDPRFLHGWERLVTSWIAQVPADFGPTDALGRRLQNWIYAANLFADAPAFRGFSAGVDDLLSARIASDADYLQANLTAERNHRTLELYALFITSLALPPSAREAERLRFAWHGLQENLLTDFRDDGVHREHSTHYHMVVLRSFLGARENARRARLEIPTAYDAVLRRAVRFAMYCHRPDGSIPALSDSDVGQYADLLEAAALALDLADVLYVATLGRRGTPPAQACANFRDAGYFVQRSRFDALRDSPAAHRHLIFDCGALGDGGHGHYDCLSIDVWCGRRLLVDPGRYTYDPSSEWRRWFKGTAAHNTVCVDGRDQTLYRPGKPKTRPVCRLLTRRSAAHLEVIGAELVTDQYDAVHRRHVLFVADEYWIVVDQLDAPTPHEFDLRFHLAPGAQDATVLDANVIMAPGVWLLFEGPGACALEEGWISPEYGVKVPAPVVSRRARSLPNATFITAIVPAVSSAAGQVPTLRVATRQASVASVVLEGTGDSGRCVDRLEWTMDASGACSAALERRTR